MTLDIEIIGQITGAIAGVGFTVFKISKVINEAISALKDEITGLKIEVAALKTITEKVTDDRERMIKVEALGMAAHKRVDEWSDIIAKIRRIEA